MQLEQVTLSKYQFEELVFASDFHTLELRQYFDKQTGEIELLGDGAETDPEIAELIEEDEFGERFILVPQIESWQSFEDMEDFTETVQDKRMRHSLEQALSRSKGVFRRFKDAIAENQDIEEQWYRFKDQRNQERVLQMFEELGIKLAIRDIDRD